MSNNDSEETNLDDMQDGEQNQQSGYNFNEGSSQEDLNQQTNRESVEINADLSYLRGASATIAGRDVTFNISVSSATQAQKILKELREGVAARHMPPPPPADATLQEQIDHWFAHELETEHVQFYAITLSMFNGLKYPDFKDIYEIILRVMKVKGRKEEDAPSRFDTHDEDLTELVRADIKPSDEKLEEIIEFRDEQYVSAISDLMRRRYRNVFLDLLPALKQIVERHRYWEIRTRAAATMAEIGKIAFHRVRNQVLEPWASDPKAYIRASVGYPLARLVEERSSRAVVIDLLNDWSNPQWRGLGETWRYRWTAASVYKQIGYIEQDWAEDVAFRGLKKLAGFDDIRIADSVIHTLVVLSLQRQLENVLLALKEWIDEGVAGSKDNIEPQGRCIVAILAFMVMSEIHIEAYKEKDEVIDEDISLNASNLFDLVRKSETRKGEMWQLLVAVGVRSFEYRLANAFFDLIARWTDYAADDLHLQNTVRNLLADVFVEAQPRYREHMLNRLNRWTRQTRNKGLTEMANSAKEKIKERVLNEPHAASSVEDRIIFRE